MKNTPFLAALGLFSAALLQPTTARPCSLAPRAEGPLLLGTIGPSPLIASTDGTLRLGDPMGRDVALTAVEPPSALAGAKSALGAPLFYYRPTEPLAPGQYQLDGHAFTVSSSAAAEDPSLGQSGKLELYLSDGDGGDCGDTSALLLDLADVAPTRHESTRFLVQFQRGSGERFSRLVSLSQRYEASLRLRFYHSFAETGHLSEEKLCVSVAGVSSTGTVSQSLDLGCVDPLDEDDPRIFGGEGSGCSATGRSTGLSALWVLLGAIGLARPRARARERARVGVGST